MTKKETIKNFLKPTKAKILLMILIFVISIFLSHTIFFPPNNEGFNSFSLSKKVFYCFSVPGVCSLYSALDLLDISYDSEEAEDISSALFLFIFSLEIIYYYVISCIILFVSKIKREKK